MIPIEEAQATVLAACSPLTPVDSSCKQMTGRVLAQDVVASENVPWFANSAVDGFAVRMNDDNVFAGFNKTLRTLNGEFSTMSVLF